MFRSRRRQKPRGRRSPQKRSYMLTVYRAPSRTRLLLYEESAIKNAKDLKNLDLREENTI